MNLQDTAHLVRNVTVPIYASTKYGPAISTPEELDDLWGALDVSLGLIRLPDEWAEGQGLPRSLRFPWDQSQGMYYLGAFHQMHCLVSQSLFINRAREALTDFVIAPSERDLLLDLNSKKGRPSKVTI